MSTTATAVNPEVTATPAPVRAVFAGPRRHGQVAIADRLSRSGLAVTPATDLTATIAALDAGPSGLCVIDLCGQDDLVSWIRTIRARHPEMSVVGITDPTRPLVAAAGLAAGLSSVLPWPFHAAELAAVVADVADRAGRIGQPDDGSVLGETLVAHSPAMRQVADLVRGVASKPQAVWLSGEPGCGRETVARAVHAASGRSAGPFVVANLGDVAAEDIEEQLFGAVADADPVVGGKGRALDRITSAGALCRAQGGTLFIRKVTAAPARVQAKLARLLRDREAMVADRRAATTIDIRVVVAGEETAASALAGGQLRRELAEVLSPVAIDVPPLRERREDIPVLAVGLLAELCDALGSPRQQFSRAALAMLSALPWPGNGRDLRATIESMVRSVERPVIQLEDLLAQAQPEGFAPRAEAGGSLREARARFEREWISAALMKHQGRVEDAARTLGIQRTNLYRKIRQLNVPRALLVRKS